MKTVLRAALLLLLLLGMLLLVPSGAIVAEAEAVELPLDMKAGIKAAIAPWPQYYLSDWEYQDPSLHIKIDPGRVNATNYLAARVTIAKPELLKRTHDEIIDALAALDCVAYIEEIK